eukprot:TRINITY_DN132_c0_g1_i2.p2 TRINITY_DN132_c0_g1~~TRINITY_DN132_c0_g1_i2.p2  ORF type:complete len:146 (+),score=3.70 TRINITY_DN132_c0_g1_i2:50-487(+)
MAARGIIIIAMLASSQLTPVTGYSSGAGSAACGFDPDSGRPGGPGNTSHGTLRNGNGGFGLVLQRSGQERDFILLNGVAGFVGFLIQTKQAGVTLASNAPNIQRGPCSKSLPIDHHHGIYTRHSLILMSTILYMDALMCMTCCRS